MYTWSVALWANWICYLKASATSAMPSKVGRTEGRQNRSGGWALDGHLRFNEEKLGFIVPADNPKIASTNKISWPIDLNWFNTPNQIWVYHLGVQHSKVRPFSVLAMVCHIVFFSPTKTPFETLVQDGLSWFVYVGVRSRDRIAFRIAYVFFWYKEIFLFPVPIINNCWPTSHTVLRNPGEGSWTASNMFEPFTAGRRRKRTMLPPWELLESLFMFPTCPRLSKYKDVYSIYIIIYICV